MSVSGSSTGFNTLFDKTKVRADPEDVREALNAALEGCGSTLGTEMDLDAIEKAAAEAEKRAGEEFMQHEIKMHEVDDDLNVLGGDEDGRENHAARIASLSFAEEALGTGSPDGLEGPASLTDDRTRRRASTRRSSGLSSFDDMAYNMFGGDAGKFSQQYMLSKWKKEAKEQFLEARGGARKTRFDGMDGDAFDSFAEDMSEDNREPGEVPKLTRMRLARIDGAKVIRHQLNIEGLYGTMEKIMMKNFSTMDNILEKSMDRLETRKEFMRLAHEAIELKKQMEEEANEKRKVEEEEQRKVQMSLGSTLTGISDLLKMDHSNFGQDVVEKMKDADSARSRSSSISSASY